MKVFKKVEVNSAQITKQNLVNISGRGTLHYALCTDIVDFESCATEIELIIDGKTLVIPSTDEYYADYSGYLSKDSITFQGVENKRQYMYLQQYEGFNENRNYLEVDTNYTVFNLQKLSLDDFDSSNDLTDRILYTEHGLRFENTLKINVSANPISDTGAIFNILYSLEE